MALHVRHALLPLLALGTLLPSASQALDLLTAYRTALAADAGYQAARATADAARELLPQARAGLLPQIYVSAGKSQNDTRQEYVSSLTGDPVSRRFNYDAENKSLNLRQPIFRLGNIAQYQQAGAQVEAAEATLDKDGQDLILRVAGSYFDVLNMQSRVDAIGAQKDAYALQLQAAEHSFKVGYGTRTDIDEAKSRHQMAIAQEIDARQQLTVAERTLGGILNQKVVADQLADINAQKLRLSTPSPDRIESWLDLAEDRNPELRGLRANIEAAQKEVDKGKAAHLPTLDLVASRAITSNDSVTTVGAAYWTTNVGVQLNIPIYNGGQVSSAVRQAEANLERIRQQYEAGKRQLDVNVAREFGNISQGVARVQALEQALTFAEQALLSTRKGVQAGTRNNIDVLNAMQQLASTRVELANARLQYALARLKLKAAAGSLEESDIETINAWLDARN